ncbi:hypothetical protein [Streptomyces sp. NBC_00080]|uniref:hypothetical protein n=1 Tax=Streptomyces sp. NBC_00080 TaxID=2975645 RepID=UPI00386A6178
MAGQDGAGDRDAQGRADLPGRGAEAGAEARLVVGEGGDDPQGEGGRRQARARRDDQQPAASSQQAYSA